MYRQFVRGFSACAVCVGCFGFAQGVCAETGELVRNGGFEAVEGGKTVGWTDAAPRYVFRDGAGRNGTRALAFANDDPKSYTLLGQDVVCRPGRVYEFEAWIRTENLREGASICLEWTDAKGQWLGGAYAEAIAGTRDWTLVRARTSPVPSNVAHVKVRPYALKGATGRAWFDDVAMREFTPKLLDGVYTTAYRNLAADGDVTFKAALNLPAGDRTLFAAWFDYLDAQGRKRRVPAAALTECEAALTLAVTDLAKGRQSIGFELVRRADGAVAGTGTTAFTRAPVPERAVWFDRHGRTIVRGEPYFPLGMYWTSVTTNRVDLYAKGPFNCLMPYGAPDSREMLDYLDSKGLKVIYSVKDIFSGTTRWTPEGIRTEADEIAYITDRAARFKDHPALLAWYLNDEMPLEMVPRLIARRELMERLDPGHPGWAVLSLYHWVRNYLDSFDVVGSDPYPIPESPALMATQFTRETVAGTMGCKPVWQVPQAFNWGAYRKTEAAKYRAPTERELRNMCWQCIANGANGLVLYSFFDLPHGGAKEPFERRWAECCRVGTEIRSLFPVLLSVDRAETPIVKGNARTDAISVRTWWKDSEAWVLVVNGGDRPVTARVPLAHRFSQVTSALGAVGKLSAPDLLEVSLAPLDVAFLRLKSIH